MTTKMSVSWPVSSDISGEGWGLQWFACRHFRLVGGRSTSLCLRMQPQMTSMTTKLNVSWPMSGDMSSEG